MLIARGLVKKNRPRAYQSDGMTVGGHKGIIIVNAPRPYPRTSQQRKVANVASECGIKKGINRRELRQKMIDCVGPKLRKS